MCYRPYPQIFLQTAAEVLEFRKPIYEFGFEGGVLSQEPKAAGDQGETVGLLETGSYGSFETDRLFDLSVLPFADAAAGTVVCIHVLEHTPDPVQAMREMERILAPGGMLVVVGWGERRKESPPNTPFRKASAALLSHLGKDSCSELEEPLWRCTPAGLSRVLASFAATFVGWQGPEGRPHTVYGIAQKTPLEESFLDRFARFGQILLERFQAARSQGVEGGLTGWLRRAWLRWRVQRRSRDPENVEELSTAYTIRCKAEEKSSVEFCSLFSPSKPSSL